MSTVCLIDPRGVGQVYRSILRKMIVVLFCSTLLFPIVAITTLDIWLSSTLAWFTGFATVFGLAAVRRYTLSH